MITPAKGQGRDSFGDSLCGHATGSRRDSLGSTALCTWPELSLPTSTDHELTWMRYGAEKQSRMLEVPVHTESLPVGRLAVQNKGHFVVEEELTLFFYLALVGLPM